MKITYDPKTDVLYIELREPPKDHYRMLDAFKHNLLSGYTIDAEIRRGDIYEDFEAEGQDPNIEASLTFAFHIEEASKVMGFKPNAFTFTLQP